MRDSLSGRDEGIWHVAHLRLRRRQVNEARRLSRWVFKQFSREAGISRGENCAGRGECDTVCEQQAPLRVCTMSVAAGPSPWSGLRRSPENFKSLRCTEETRIRCGHILDDLFSRLCVDECFLGSFAGEIW